jgi:hypothetical protein
MTVRAVVAIAVAAGAALSGCDVEPAPEPPRRPAAGRAPAPAPDYCAYPTARDAGAARPSKEDPRTLVLRRRDLPSTFDFNSRMGVERLTFEGGEVGALLDRTGFRDAAFGHYRAGQKPPYRPPGAPPPPQGCAAPRTEVVSAALVFGDAGGAKRAYLERELLASSAAGLGAGPIGSRTRSSPAAVPGSDEAELLTHRTDHDGGAQHAIAWRQGAVIGIVSVTGGRRSPDAVLVPQLARRQAARIGASK